MVAPRSEHSLRSSQRRGAGLAFKSVLRRRSGDRRPKAAYRLDDQGVNARSAVCAAASALEYALLMVVIVTAIAAALVTFGGEFGPAFTEIGQEVAESAGEVVD